MFDGEVVYIIDFEYLEVAPLDYQLDKWRRLVKYPHLLANEKDKKRIKEEKSM